MAPEYLTKVGILVSIAGREFNEEQLEKGSIAAVKIRHNSFASNAQKLKNSGEI
jgi:hypothetical protein